MRSAAVLAETIVDFECSWSNEGRHFHCEMMQLSGEKINTGLFDLRIHEHTNVSWLWQIVKRHVDHPITSIALVIGEHEFRYEHHLKQRDLRSLQDLRFDLVDL